MDLELQKILRKCEIDISFFAHGSKQIPETRQTSPFRLQGFWLIPEQTSQNPALAHTQWKQHYFKLNCFDQFKVTLDSASVIGYN